MKHGMGSVVPLAPGRRTLAQRAAPMLWFVWFVVLFVLAYAATDFLGELGEG